MRNGWRMADWHKILLIALPLLFLGAGMVGFLQRRR